MTSDFASFRGRLPATEQLPRTTKMAILGLVSTPADVSPVRAVVFGAHFSG